MPRELITIQVGQCGMQLGTRFWDLALREHAAAMEQDGVGTGGSPVFDEAISSFFRNVKTSRSGCVDVPVGDGTSPIYSLRARAVCIDMEEGVLNRLQRSPMGELFDNAQFVKDVSGSGNNWAHGHGHYGPLYAESILEAVRVAAEKCDSLQSFFLMHSLGGGTGSGLGTYILHLLADAYPDVYRFNTAVFPAGGGSSDVVTAPYNSVLALNQMRLFSDAVLPVDNEALVEIVRRMYQHNHTPIGGPAQSLTPQHQQQGGVLDAGVMSHLGVPSTAPGGDTAPGVAPGAAAAAAAAANAERGRAFEDMNGVAAHLLTSLTASMRFPGALNIDLNEITMNLVPFPRMHFLVSSLVPLHAGRSAQPRSLDQMFSDTLSPHSQLITPAPLPASASTYLAMGLFARGPSIHISDIARNVARLKQQVTLARWNPDGFKIGLCSVPPVGVQRSVLALSNNTCIAGTFEAMRDRFHRLYRRRAHVHHYTEYIEAAAFDDAAEGLEELIGDYRGAETLAPSGDARMRPLV